MAKNRVSFDYGPTPQLAEPGVAYRERDFVGRGGVLAVPPESPTRAAKGDLSMKAIVGFAPRPLSHGGLPFALKGGK